MERGTIAICFVEEALQAVRARGLDPDVLLLQVGISPGLLEAQQARVSTAQYGALWRAIAQALDDEFFGLDSRRMKLGSFGMLCRAVVHCSTLEKALGRALRFYGLLLDDFGATLSQQGHFAKLALDDRSGHTTLRAFAHEAMLIMLYGLMCWLIGRRIPIRLMELAFPEPAHSSEYKVRYSSTLHFDQPNTAIVFDAEYLDQAVIQDEQSVKEFLRIIPENILVKYKNTNSVTAKIRRRLRQSPLHELPDFEVLALELHTASATLRRRLHEEGESYQSIKDQLRRDVAITYLSDSEKSVTDIALELGFAEPSAFHRAFKKWTGASPGEYRRTLSSPRSTSSMRIEDHHE